uniref:Ycf37 n=1 Tax=Coccophora langsdorfii TaxID=74099 RepID=A0A1L2F1S0_9PHAE|nr:Ycf37 [Coccophora langsdorfii]ANS72271.1 Ycf37 [Coccophora langsdorfii]
MTSLFPLIYSITLFCFLILIISFIIKQVIDTQKLEKKTFELQLLIKKDNTSYEVYYKLGQLYLKKKLFPKAILVFRKAINNWDINDNIGLGHLYNIIGFTYFTLKEYNLAIYYYKISLKIIPDYTIALINLAYVYEKQNFLLDSYNSYNKVLYFNNNNNLALKRIKIISRLLKID